MSAGGLSYSGLVNYGASTLPSVESWGTNMNILRDPPKSIHTRRKDKVGDTSSITEMIDESGDRAAEAILVYPRGINPMVGVSYSNYGNNGGGGQAGSLTGLSHSFTSLTTGNTQSFLPYRTAVDGAFRPPVKSQTELLPLSRQPRVWTSQMTTPGFADYSKKLRDCGTAENTREVQENTIKTFVRPTYSQSIEKPIEEPNETKYSIQKAMNLEGHSGMRTMDISEQYVGTPNQGIVQEQPLQANNVVANVGNTRNFVNNNEFNPDNFIQNTNTHTVNSNNSGMGETNIEDIIDIDTSKYIQGINIIDHTAPYSAPGDGTKYIHDNLQRDRVLPNYQAQTNIADSRINKNIMHINEIKLEQNKPTATFRTGGMVKMDNNNVKPNASLLQKIKPGGYLGNNASTKNSGERISKIPTLQENGKTKLFKFMNNESYNRN